MSRQLPETRTAQHPLSVPFNGCRNDPGKAISDALAAPRQFQDIGEAPHLCRLHPSAISGFKQMPKAFMPEAFNH
jgi:hypothetical protein